MKISEVTSTPTIVKTIEKKIKKSSEEAVGYLREGKICTIASKSSKLLLGEHNIAFTKLIEKKITNCTYPIYSCNFFQTNNINFNETKNGSLHISHLHGPTTLGVARYLLTKKRGNDSDLSLTASLKNLNLSVRGATPQASLQSLALDSSPALTPSQVVKKLISIYNGIVVDTKSTTPSPDNTEICVWKSKSSSSHIGLYLPSAENKLYRLSSLEESILKIDGYLYSELETFITSTGQTEAVAISQKRPSNFADKPHVWLSQSRKGSYGLYLPETGQILVQKIIDLAMKLKDYQQSTLLKFEYITSKEIQVIKETHGINVIPLFHNQIPIAYCYTKDRLFKNVMISCHGQAYDSTIPKFHVPSNITLSFAAPREHILMSSTIDYIRMLRADEFCLRETDPSQIYDKSQQSCTDYRLKGNIDIEKEDAINIVKDITSSDYSNLTYPFDLIWINPLIKKVFFKDLLNSISKQIPSTETSNIICHFCRATSLSSPNFDPFTQRVIPS